MSIDFEDVASDLMDIKEEGMHGSRTLSKN
jgi:hypothetical protein